MEFPIQVTQNIKLGFIENNRTEMSDDSDREVLKMLDFQFLYRGDCYYNLFVAPGDLNEDLVKYSCLEGSSELFASFEDQLEHDDDLWPQLCKLGKQHVEEFNKEQDAWVAMNNQG